MNKKYHVYLSVMLLAVCFIGVVLAQENIQYPIAELGGCADKAECKSYCDDSGNIKICLDFARKNKMMPEEDLKKAETFIELGNKGPGSCSSKEECDLFCDDVNHLAECVAFAEQNGLLSGEQLDEARKAQAAIAKGVVPPPCKGKKECDIYCENPDNMEICVDFAIQAGFIQGKELENAQKMLAAVKRGAKPPACNGKEDCDAYCQQAEHFQECADFALAAGFMTEEEAAMAQKTGGKGPGGCSGKEECDDFCQDSANQETCFGFGIDNGLISAEDLIRMEEDRQKMKESLAQAPDEVIACLERQLGSDVVEKIKSGEFMPSQSIGDQMRVCFEKIMPLPQNIAPGDASVLFPVGGSNLPAGPGGCASPEECKAYCESHREECMNFGPGGGQGIRVLPALGVEPSGQNVPAVPMEQTDLFGKIPGSLPPMPEQQMNDIQPMIPQNLPPGDYLRPSVLPAMPPMPQDQPMPQLPPSGLVGPNLILGSLVKALFIIFGI